jgi:hypothetical protein
MIATSALGGGRESFVRRRGRMHTRTFPPRITNHRLGLRILSDSQRPLTWSVGTSRALPCGSVLITSS